MAAVDPSRGTVAGGRVWTLAQDPPVSVDPEMDRRLARILPIAKFGGIGIGLVCGYVATIAATVSWPPAAFWSTPQFIELFLVVAIPVSLAEYSLSPRILRWMAKATRLRVRSLSALDGRLRVELAVGRPFTVPLKRLRMSPAPVSDGWYRVSLPSGKTSVRFYVPEEIGRELLPLVARWAPCQLTRCSSRSGSNEAGGPSLLAAPWQTGHRISPTLRLFVQDLPSPVAGPPPGWEWDEGAVTRRRTLVRPGPGGPLRKSA
jgi:hypothetical protein